ncbi:MAG: sterol desaturase/sphingolipid hydroxylase (fatty acid hydroxylase superfamily) [Granulosicoccus sp.]|jgi:sterol desaturase/sphingolipid hydroxylase (fatty acid hydroxylase superfamily)
MNLTEAFQSLDAQGLNDDPTVYFIPGFAILILLEIIVSNWQHLKVHVWKDSAASIGMGIGSLFIGVVVKTIAFGLMVYVHQYAIFDIGYQWWAWVILFFADDFCMYWHHRLSHDIRLLWAAHINHHSSMNYNLAVALRQSWTEILYKYTFWMWLPLLGFEPLMIFTMISLNLIYQFWVHTKTIKSLGPLELIFNTPSHHRVHHASNVRYLDRNMGGILIIWDKLFGTFQKEEETDPVEYGLTSNIHTHNLFKIAFHEFGNILKDVKRAPNVGSKLKYLFMPPGWSHDGSTKTSRELRKEKGLM